MRERKWVDCPACGAKSTMRYQRDVAERFNLHEYAPVEVTGLDGHFCQACGDGFWSLKSERKIAIALAEEMARQDSQRVVASEIASVQEAAEALNVTQQGIHKMMKEGRLPYVFAAGRRLPIRRHVIAKTQNAGRHEFQRH